MSRTQDLVVLIMVLRELMDIFIACDRVLTSLITNEVNIIARCCYLNTVLFKIKADKGWAI